MIPEHATLSTEEIQRRLRATQAMRHVWTHRDRQSPWKRYCLRCGTIMTPANVDVLCRRHGG